MRHQVTETKSICKDWQQASQNNKELDSSVSQMENLLETSKAEGNLAISPRFIQPSPGQQSTDSGFMSDASQKIVHYANHQDSACFPNSTLLNEFDMFSAPGQQDNSAANINCDFLQEVFVANDQNVLDCNPTWEDTNYSNEELTEIVEQILSTISSNFNENDCVNQWSDNVMSELTKFDKSETDLINESALSLTHKVDGKELCDNCGNMLENSEECCKLCGHLLQRSLEFHQAIDIFHLDETPPGEETQPPNRVCAVQPAVRNVGVVEPRVVVKIPWSKIQMKNKKHCNKKETDSKFTLSSSVIEAESELSFKRNEKTYPQQFSITEKLPEHFRQALERKCLGATNFKQLPKPKKKQKEKKRTKNAKKKLENEGNSLEKIREDEKEKGCLSYVAVTEEKKMSVEIKCTSLLHDESKKPEIQQHAFGDERCQEEGFSRYCNSCLDFGDLARASNYQSQSLFSKNANQTKAKASVSPVEPATHQKDYDLKRRSQDDLHQTASKVKVVEKSPRQVNSYSKEDELEETKLQTLDKLRNSNESKLTDFILNKKPITAAVAPTLSLATQNQPSISISPNSRAFQFGKCTILAKSTAVIGPASKQSPIIEANKQVMNPLLTTNLKSINSKPCHPIIALDQQSISRALLSQVPVPPSQLSSSNTSKKGSITSKCVSSSTWEEKPNTVHIKPSCISLPMVPAVPLATTVHTKQSKNEFSTNNKVIYSSKVLSSSPSHSGDENAKRKSFSADNQTVQVVKQDTKFCNVVNTDESSSEEEEDNFSDTEFKLVTSSGTHLENASKTNLEAVKNQESCTKFVMEKEIDTKWLHCEVESCHFWTKKQIRMVRHKQCHSFDENNKPIYYCPDCSVRINTLTKLLRHDRKLHTGFKDYECKICEAEVTDIGIHMRVHKFEKQFSCTTCGLQFRHRNSLVRHLFQHSDRQFRCQNCEVIFLSPLRFRDHVKKKHPFSTQAKSLGLESTSQHLRPYAPIAPAPAKSSSLNGPTSTSTQAQVTSSTTTLLLPQTVQSSQMASLVLNNGTLYVMNPQPSFQQPLLVSMPSQQSVFISSPQIPTFLSATNPGSYLLTPQGLAVTAQQPVFLSAGPVQTSTVSVPVTTNGPTLVKSTN